MPTRFRAKPSRAPDEQAKSGRRQPRIDLRHAELGRVKRLKSGGGTVGKSIARDVGRCPVDELRQMFLDEYLDSAPLPRVDLVKAMQDEGIVGASMPPAGPLEAPTGSASESENEGPLEAPSRPPRGGASVSVSVSASEVVDASGSRNGPSRAHTREAGVDQAKLPETLPDHLHDRVSPVLEVLTRVQRERGGNEPTVRGVGLAITAFPNKDHLGVVGELEHWSTAGNGRNKPQKDWARLYRTFLERAADGAPLRLVSGPPIVGRTAGIAPVANTGDFSRFKTP